MEKAVPKSYTLSISLIFPSINQSVPLKIKPRAKGLAQLIRGVHRPPVTPVARLATDGVPSLLMSRSTAPTRFRSPVPMPHLSAALLKQKSWSPDASRNEAWLRRQGNHGHRNRRSKSVTDEDLDDLKACIELGFGFDSDSPDMDQRLSDTLPALGFYHAVNKQYYDSVSKTSPVSECDSPSSAGSSHSILGPGENPETVKTRLRRWAQVVACSVRQSSSGG